MGEESQQDSEVLDSRIRIKVVSQAGISHMSMEEYLYGALPGVISADYELECLKAQAILLRTSLIRRYREQVEAGNVELEAPAETYLTRRQLEELWGSGFQDKYDKIQQAVSETKGIYITYNGLPIEVCYFRVSAGRTRYGSEVLEGELLYLQSVECPKDYLSEEYLTQVTIKEKDMVNILGGEVWDIQRDSAGYCQNITLRITKNGKEELVGQSGEWLRNKLGLPSAHFTMEDKGKEILLTIKGAGHGLGMSQFGANEMAKEGKDYNIMLSYFFQNITMDKYE